MIERKSLEQVHEYWRAPPDANNAAHRYAEVSPARSEALVQVVERYVPKQGKILEVGCNAGRNLHYLVGPEQSRLIRRRLDSRVREQYPIARMSPSGLP